VSDGGVYMAFGECLRCRRPFAFNPVAVPSIRVDGIREPLCQDCFDALNAERARLGLKPWPLQPDAYTPLPEGEMP
jgi:hypothetical protein